MNHKPITGTWHSPDTMKHNTVATNAITEISQWTSDIRRKPGEHLLVRDLLSRPFKQPVAKANQSSDFPEYISPSATMAALEALIQKMETIDWPLVPVQHRSLILDLFHHQDHPSAKETLRRTAEKYYWPQSARINIDQKFSIILLS